MEEEKVKCPRCGSEQITNRGYSHGNHCLRCGKEWDPEVEWKKEQIKKYAEEHGVSESEAEKKLKLEEKGCLGCSTGFIVFIIIFFIVGFIVVMLLNKYCSPY